MKKISLFLSLFVTLLLNNKVFADANTALTADQANKLVDWFKYSSPYIFSFCEPCGDTYVEVYYVESAQIKACSYAAGMYEVHYTGQKLFKFEVKRIPHNTFTLFETTNKTAILSGKIQDVVSTNYHLCSFFAGDGIAVFESFFDNSGELPDFEITLPDENAIKKVCRNPLVNDLVNGLETFRSIGD